MFFQGQILCKPPLWEFRDDLLPGGYARIATVASLNRNFGTSAGLLPYELQNHAKTQFRMHVPKGSHRIIWQKSQSKAAISTVCVVKIQHVSIACSESLNLKHKIGGLRVHTFLQAVAQSSKVVGTVLNLSINS